MLIISLKTLVFSPDSVDNLRTFLPIRLYYDEYIFTYTYVKKRKSCISRYRSVSIASIISRFLGFSFAVNSEKGQAG